MVAVLPGKYSISFKLYFAWLKRRCPMLALYCTSSRFRKPNLSGLFNLVFIPTLILSLILFLSTTYGYSAQVTLAWNPNSESDLAGYKIYYGNSSRNYGSNVDVGNLTSYTIQNLAEGQTYYLAVTASI